MPNTQALPDPTPIRVDKNQPIPTIRVHVGNAQLGTYDIILWPRRGRPLRIGRGSTMDAEPDVHRIVKTREQLQRINRFVITVVVVVQAVERKPGSRWNCEIEVTQGDTELDRFTDGDAVDAVLTTVSRAYEVELVG